jgi:hypothetical protein
MWVNGPRLSLKYVLSQSRLMPGRLKNVRVEGWDEMLSKMRQFWQQGKEATLETSHGQNLTGAVEISFRLLMWNFTNAEIETEREKLWQTQSNSHY